MSNADINARLSMVFEAVNDAKQAISQGNAVDLASLETEVETICRLITKSPAHDAPKELEQAIQSLLSDLTLLSQALGKQHSQYVSTIGLSKLAHKAYAPINQDLPDNDSEGENT
ncbi:MAG: hypothetical protein CBB68_09780 [Rhodospirillaceae bacterium TMED8]|nr:hypothetical protein [Magnetovibrio sp.]OUT50147.1 MAG: hypothetical protein CBB68_09780 [Rhodospirillaceae bacterium TMED8]|tara:strand:- start:105 stop:449 length:345 start_codon:yes stop_codon:yes gene_type:complete